MTANHLASVPQRSHLLKGKINCYALWPSSVRIDPFRRALQLNSASIPEPYLSIDGDLARLNPRRLVCDGDRRSSDDVRHIEDHAKIKDWAKMVCYYIAHCTPLPVMKILNLFLTQK